MCLHFSKANLVGIEKKILHCVVFTLGSLVSANVTFPAVWDKLGLLLAFGKVGTWALRKSF